MGTFPQRVAVVVRHRCSQPPTVAQVLSSLGQDTRLSFASTAKISGRSASVA
jgi:hypothetical protein